jgi:hypothetical protein
LASREGLSSMELVSSSSFVPSSNYSFCKGLPLVSSVSHCIEPPVTEVSFLYFGTSTFKCTIRIRRDGSVGKETGLRHGRPRNFDSHHGQVTEVMELLLSTRYRGGPSSEVKRPGREADHLHIARRLGMRVTVRPRPHTSSWHGA